MFEKLIDLIDKWNFYTKEDQNINFTYGFDYSYNVNSIHCFICTISFSKSGVFKFGTHDIESMYYKMKEFYTERFADPSIEPEMFKITEIEMDRRIIRLLK